MNAKQLIAAVAVFAATGSVFAADVTPFADQENFVSTKTRAEVIAEAKQARADGTLIQANVYSFDPVAVAGNRTRDEVRTEAIQSAKAHKFNAGYDVGG